MTKEVLAFFFFNALAAYHLTVNSNISQNLPQMFPLKCARYCTFKLLKLDPPVPSDQGSAKSREFAPPGWFSRPGTSTMHCCLLNHICAAIECSWGKMWAPCRASQAPTVVTSSLSDHLGRATEAENQGLWVVISCFQG